MDNTEDNRITRQEALKMQAILQASKRVPEYYQTGFKGLTQYLLYITTYYCTDLPSSTNANTFIPCLVDSMSQYALAFRDLDNRALTFVAEWFWDQYIKGNVDTDTIEV